MKLVVELSKCAGRMLLQSRMRIAVEMWVAVQMKQERQWRLYGDI